MDTGEAREIRFFRLSLAWVGVALVGVALLVTVVLGFWSTHVSAGAQPQNAGPQSTPSPNPFYWPVLLGSVACMLAGVVGLAVLRRFHWRTSV
jgi:purine-cytosine permease-like protein